MSCPRWLYHPHEPLPEASDPNAICGGKGAGLRQLWVARLPSPPSFTITTVACREYFALGRRWPDGLREQVFEAVSVLERTAGRPYAAGPRPLLLAVRSGAAISMPGMLLTLLNCGLTRELAESLESPATWLAYAQLVRDLAAASQLALRENQRPGPGAARRSCLDLLGEYEDVRGLPFPQDPWELLQQCVSAVFDSWTGERAAAYRHRQQFDDAQGTAVTVQAMVATEAAGVLFSRDPLRGTGDSFVIEAVRGGGESLVAGRAVPQRYEVRRSLPSRPEAGEKTAGIEAAGHNVPEEPILGPVELRELTSLAARVESLLGGPADIEWGYAEGQAVLFQVRRMDEAATEERLAEVRRDEIARLQRSADEHRSRLWVRHNLGETLPFPTPLTWDLVRRWMGGRGGFGNMYRSLGYVPSQRVCADGFLELVAGRVYADPDRLSEVFSSGLPLGYDMQVLRHTPSLLDLGPTSFAPEHADGWLLFRLPWVVWKLWRSARRVRRESVQVVERFEQRALPAFLSYVEQQRSENLSRLNDRELAARLEQRCARVLDEFAAEALRPAFFAGLALQALEKRLVRLLGSQEGSRMARDLVLGLAEPPAAAYEGSLYRVARGQLALADFLDQYGHRGPGEMELASPRWREIPDQLERLGVWLKDAETPDPETLREHAAGERNRAEQLLGERLAWHGAASFAALVDREARQAQRLLPYRESGRDALLRGYELIRQVVQEIARRRDLGEEVYFLRYEELLTLSNSPGVLGPPAGRSRNRESGPDASPRGDLERLFAPLPWREALRQRQQRWQLLQRLAVPDAVDAEQLEQVGAPQPLRSTSGVSLPATPLSAGTARGPAWVWRAARPMPDAPRGFVLVCASLDTGLTPLLLRAAAVVVERGGLLSHGAIVARQLGIPALVVADAGRLLRDGQPVVVDGDRGRLLCEGDARP